MNYVRAIAGRRLAIKVKNHLRRHSVLAHVTTDGITTIEVMAPKTWETAEAAKDAIYGAFVRCGAFKWELDKLAMEAHGWEA